MEENPVKKVLMKDKENAEKERGKEYKGEDGKIPKLARLASSANLMLPKVLQSGLPGQTVGIQTVFRKMNFITLFFPNDFQMMN